MTFHTVQCAWVSRQDEQDEIPTTKYIIQSIYMNQSCISSIMRANRAIKLTHLNQVLHVQNEKLSDTNTAQTSLNLGEKDTVK